MSDERGFTVVELLVTLVVGLLLLFSVYQLYNYIISDSMDARMRSTASSIAYQLMRESEGLVINPCTSNPAVSPTIPAGSGLPSPSATVTLSCAPSMPISITLITATVTYGSPQRTVKHATYVRAR